MKKTSKRIISVFLCVLMLMSVCVFPAMAEEKKDLYLFIGDSMSFDFTGMYDLYKPTVTYAQQTADALGLETSEALKIPGGRFQDAYAMMSDYDGDEYTWDERGGWISDRAMRDRYIENVSKADVLSVQLGYSGVSMFMLKNMLNVIEGNGPLYNTDISQMFTDEIAKITPYIEKCTEMVMNVLGRENIEALTQYLNQLTEQQKQAIDAAFGSSLDSLKSVAEIIKEINSTLLYTLLGHCVYFDRTVEQIYKLNPDVDLYVMSLANPLQHLKLSFDLGGREYVIDIGDLLGSVYDIMNLYMRVLSPYSNKYYFVENIEAIDNFGMAMARDEEMARAILYTYFNGEHYTGYESADKTPRQAEAYAKADALAPGMTKALQNTTNINLNKLVASLPSDLSSITTDADKNIEKMAGLDENGNPTATYFEQLMAHVSMLTLMIGVYAHPVQATHDAEAQVLIKAMQDKTVSPQGIAYHKLMSPVENLLAVAKKTGSSIESMISWAAELCKDNDNGSIPTVSPMITGIVKQMSAPVVNTITYMNTVRHSVTTAMCSALTRAATLFR